MALWIAMIVLAATTSCSINDDVPEALVALSDGHVSDGRTGAALTDEGLMTRLLRADFILLGEHHDNAAHHRHQAWIVEQLAARGRRLVVAFEMIDADQTPRLEAFMSKSSRDAAQLGKALDWDRSGWPAWSHYAPIAEAALRRGFAIVAANLPPAQARAVARDGIAALPPPLVRDLGLTTIANDPAAAAILASHAAVMQAAHCGQLPAARLSTFAQAQYARDAHMAYRMVAAWRDTTARADPHPLVVLIAGAEHARTDRGVPHHLARLAPGSRVVALAFVEEESRVVREAQPAYDLVWRTAPVTRDDPCAAMSRGSPG